ncbi:MAG: asparagine synthase (glutamine-hydrolyzing) [Bacteroidetes bacterium GWF2_38_335]|nr:MAG: asparagine synthase (glutamine-hydrolyzing) [Bacteroidetes bacterium GWF2_38_335]OFY78225.1 MAG: asparagine synthase (glutamine-hydrolyzing) [Bacteroidetes bacterium RIFOXYA12_FULL_38_20]
MCGIAGFFCSDNIFTREEIHRMTDVIAHRGPDAEGHYINAPAVLGHRRLSIIDLSEQANMPMYSRCGRFVMVYNGEVYNFKDIARQLDIPLRTTGDSEVILEAYVRWKEKMPSKLIGMFAGVIYDIEHEKLFIFRDRMGIKPLFYFRDEKHFAFASEIKSLLQLSPVSKSRMIDHEAVTEFLHLGYIPEPKTIYRNIRKFPSGCYAVYSAKSFEITPYWKAEDCIKPEVLSNEKTALSKLNELLVDSVRMRLISDVPFGTLLSGGIDSSLVTAIAQKESGKSISTFSIGFKESKFNEAGYARKVAEYLNTNHHEYFLSQEDALATIDDIFTSYDEPFADSSAIPTMLVSKMARSKVSMTLSGDGGDELFHGYGAYRWANRLEMPMIKSLRKPIASVLSKMPDRYKRASNLFLYPEERKKSHIFSQEQYLFSLAETEKIIRGDFYLPPGFSENFNLNRKLNPAEQQAFFDLKMYLKDDLLVKVDRASMKYSLENRVPLLDHRIVEFALNLSPGLKIKNGVQKYLLKKVLYQYVPEKMFNRPKWGFSIPLGTWMRKELKSKIDEYLSEEKIKQTAVLNFDEVQKLKIRFEKGQDHLYNRVWAVYVLMRFLDDQR